MRQGLQPPPLDGLNERILRQYRTMYDVFLAERHLIPEGHFYEVRFEDLESEPLTVMRQLYAALNLPAFTQVEPGLCRYLDSISGYQKNEFLELPVELRSQIAHAWEPYFAEWGYPR